jgi:hypothetical protein
MGFEGVAEFHGPTELGRDIVAHKKGDFGYTESVVVVAKSVRISGEAATEVARQIRQAINTPFRSVAGNEERLADKVWVVTNKDIPLQAKEKICSEFDSKQLRSIIWIDGSELWEQWRKHFPVGFSDLAEELQRRLRDVDSAFRPRIIIDSKSQITEIHAGDIEKLDEDHLKFGTSFSFPNDPEGMEKKREFEALLETGSPARIPGKFFKLSLPPALEEMFKAAFGSTPGDFDWINISSFQDDFHIPVSVVVTSDTGDRAEIPYIDLKRTQAGLKEVTLTNESQPIPIKMTLRVSANELAGNYSFEITPAPVTASWLKVWIDLQRCFSMPGAITVRLVESGQVVYSGRRSTTQDFGVSEAEIQIVDDLAQVEVILGQPVYVPEDEWTHDEIEVLKKLRHLVSDPVIDATWTDMKGTVEANQAVEALGSFLDCTSHQVVREMNEQVELAGRTLDLGRVRQIATSVKLEDCDALLLEIEEKRGTNEILKVTFIPGENDKLTSHYLDWDLEATPKVTDSPANISSQDNSITDAESLS